MEVLNFDLELVADKVGDAGIRSSAGGIYQNTQWHLNVGDKVTVQVFSFPNLPETTYPNERRTKQCSLFRPSFVLTVKLDFR